MANYPTTSWDETKPAGTRDINLGDDDMREFKTQIREVLGQDHLVASSGQGSTWGHHNIVTLLVQTSITALADAGKIYTKDVNSKAELHFKDEDSNEIQITSAGAILLDSGRVTNNTYIKAIDAAGTGTVDLIKANASDKAVVPDEAQLATSAAPSADAQIANKKYVDDSVNMIQVVNVQSGAVNTGTTAIPLDDTIPQNDEGDEFLSLAITPTSATNLLKIDVVLHISNSADNPHAALFQDSTANALAVGISSNYASEYGQALRPIVFTHYMTAGTTSETTFKVRAGAASGTTTFNGLAGARRFGGVLASSITITEIAA